MTLTFAEAGEQDIPDLTRVMTRAFDDESRTYRGLDKGGPEGYDNGDFFRQWMLGYDETTGYTILLDGEVVGGLIVWIIPGGHNHLGVIFVDPAVQDRGIGTQAWQFVERTYPGAKSWRLETPAWSLKNHAFYERKCGFTKIDETDSPDGVMFVYRKIIHPD
ncbi:MAG TPA: GNAT family N-acetyltransferase [Aggregatilinea sp.]|uniref:GNAT family N-acetyltransferase n=1 Tax=Aggregatilinea sp. TaxID=2806333 RepID=UPI002CBD9A4A|nr:GNAT family N-acetyltransferase [Aggregatilinea sp.]HML24591.1 GNAT family N-acetyltransferase [Aggregatilinea sp.]